MNFDAATIFFKELVLQSRLPAELRISSDNYIQISVPRHGIIEQLQDEIRKQAVQRGFKDESTPDWLIFRG
jgi:hypothetical protein